MPNDAPTDEKISRCDSKEWGRAYNTSAIININEY